MPRSKKITSLLEKVSGEEEIEFIIPHPFLPPRYREMSSEKNMVLVLDRDMTLHVRWEGERLTEWNSITPGESRRIVRSVLGNLDKYRGDIRAFGRFIDRYAEMPFQDPRYDGVSEAEEKAREKVATAKRENGVEEVAPPIGTPTNCLAMGGESPFPNLEW